jgi:hypothetical protein
MWITMLSCTHLQFVITVWEILYWAHGTVKETEAQKATEVICAWHQIWWEIRLLEVPRVLMHDHTNNSQLLFLMIKKLQFKKVLVTFHYNDILKVQLKGSWVRFSYTLDNQKQVHCVSFQRVSLWRHSSLSKFFLYWSRGRHTGVCIW